MDAMYPVRPAESVKIPLLRDISRLEFVLQATSWYEEPEVGEAELVPETVAVGACGWPSERVETGLAVDFIVHPACGWPSTIWLAAQAVTVHPACG